MYKLLFIGLLLFSFQTYGQDYYGNYEHNEKIDGYIFYRTINLHDDYTFTYKYLYNNNNDTDSAKGTFTIDKNIIKLNYSTPHSFIDTIKIPVQRQINTNPPIKYKDYESSTVKLDNRIAYYRPTELVFKHNGLIIYKNVGSGDRVVKKKIRLKKVDRD